MKKIFVLPFVALLNFGLADDDMWSYSIFENVILDAALLNKVNDQQYTETNICKKCAQKLINLSNGDVELAVTRLANWFGYYSYENNDYDYWKNQEKVVNEFCMNLKKHMISLRGEKS